MNKTITFFFILSINFCTQENGQNDINGLTYQDSSLSQSIVSSQSQVEQQVNVLKLIFGTLDDDNKQIQYLKKHVQASSELKGFCPNVKTTKCSSSLIKHVTNQMSDAYIKMKMIREEMKQIDESIQSLSGTIRVFRYITEEYKFYGEFQNYYTQGNMEEGEGEERIKKSLEYIKELKNYKGQALNLFNELRKQIVQYYGGIFCGLCNNEMKKFSYNYNQDGYDYMVIQLNQNTKIELIKLLQKFNKFQNFLYKVVEVARVANSYSGQLRSLDSIVFLNIYQNAGKNYKAINDGLELCKTKQTIENFLGQGDMDCNTLLSYTAPFTAIDYFVPFDTAFQHIMPGLNYINMNKEKAVVTQYKDPKGKMVDFSQIDKTIQLLKRPQESKELYQDFQQTGIDVTKQNFNYETLRTLTKKNRPGMFSNMFNFGLI